VFRLWLICGNGTITLFGTLFTEHLPLLRLGNTVYNSGRTTPRFRLGLLPVHSQLLGESHLVSFPLLINMLKFGR